MEIANIKIYIDGEWEFTDLNLLTRVYIQVYGFLYSLDVADDFIDEEIQYIYGKYPWRGGYSAVNFYQNLYSKMPNEYRPKIKSIQYASPGFIELTQLVDVAKDIAQIVGYVSASIIAGNKTYSIIEKGMRERKISRIDLRKKKLSLLEKERDFIHKSIEDISKIMGVKKETLARLHLRAENNQLAVLKMLSSLYRRARDLATLQNKNKLDLKSGVDEQKSSNK